MNFWNPFWRGRLRRVTKPIEISVSSLLNYAFAILYNPFKLSSFLRYADSCFSNFSVQMQYLRGLIKIQVLLSKAGDSVSLIGSQVKLEQLAGPWTTLWESKTVCFYNEGWESLIWNLTPKAEMFQNLKLFEVSMIKKKMENPIHNMAKMQPY